MRVITGKAKGKKLRALPGENVRPTADGVKEAIFSIIQFELEGATALDLFCGTGQLGIEALSRGAEKAVFVDSSPESVRITRENIAACGFEENAVTVNMPNGAFLRSCRSVFDIALLDPPYGRGLIQKSLPRLAELMSEDGVIVCEHEKECVLPEKAGRFALKKVYRHGKISLTVYRKADDLQ